MIKINLASRKQPLQASGKSGGSGPISLGGLGGLGGLGSLAGGSLLSSDQLKDALREIPWRKVAIPVIVSLAAGYIEDQVKESELHALDLEINTVLADKPRLEGEIKKMKQAEDTKKTLEADELVLRTKVDTIRKLVEGRGATPKFLIDLASNTPREVWLSDVKVENAKIELQGYSLGFGQISDFMKALGESVYFTDLNLKNTQTVKDDLGADVTNFELSARRK